MADNSIGLGRWLQLRTTYPPIPCHHRIHSYRAQSTPLCYMTAMRFIHSLTGLAFKPAKCLTTLFTIKARSRNSISRWWNDDALGSYIVPVTLVDWPGMALSRCKHTFWRIILSSSFASFHLTSNKLFIYHCLLSKTIIISSLFHYLILFHRLLYLGCLP